jgi:hypothetical protein
MFMSEPQYHHPIHLREYDTESPTKQDGEMSIVFYALKELLYGVDENNPRVQSTESTDTRLIHHFAYDHLVPDTLHQWTSYEHSKLNVEHTQYLGESVLKEAFKVHFKTRVVGKETPNYNFMSRFYLQRSQDEKTPYLGSVIRPSVYDTEPVGAYGEPITVYDCNLLYDQVAVIVDTIEGNAEAKRNNFW